MQEHGSFEMEVKDQTIIINAFDAWNYEAALRFEKEYKKHADEIKGNPWACLVDLSAWELSTPEVKAVIDRVNEWANANNQRYEVVIGYTQIQKTVFETTYEILTNVEVNFCEKIEHAYQWLAERGVLSR